MSLTTTKLLSAAETAYALRQLLWGDRNWRDFLADCIRGKAGLGGWLVLDPYAADEQGHPLYHPAAIAAFAKAAREMTPSWEPATEVISKPYVHDDTIGLPWRMRVAKPAAGRPARR